MDFFEVLDRVVDLLRRRGRVTYGALKLQFQLDDAQVEVLKDELIYAQHLAVDEDGRVLVWRGEEHSTPPSPSPHADQSDIIQDDRPTQTSSPAAQLHASDAERRQLTVMFCDLVGSTELSGQLDPEQLREVVRVYQETAAAVIQRYEGYVAQYLGDGLLIYFGYPSAHEDDAVRAVHTGLGILDAMSTVNPRLQSNYGVQLAVRIGVHTGPVVIGEVGGGRRHEQLALGATLNVAARLEGMAPPNTVVISEATYRLITGYFTSEDLGTHTLRGVAAPIQAYRIIEASGAQTRLEVTAGRGFTPLVGREQESGLLAERWAHVKEGMGHVVLLSGEAGIGKSRVVEVVKETIGNELHTRVECRSSPYYQNTALYPFIDLFQRFLQWHPHDSAEAKADKLEQLLSTSRLPVVETVPLLAALLSLPLAQERYPTLQLTPQRQRQKTLEVLLALVFDLAARQPVLFILEDLHWTDPTTLEWLALLIDQIPTASMLLLLTHRPEFESPWGVRSYLTPLPLDRLTQVQVETMVERVAEGKRIPAAVMQYLVQQTDGVPLFVEEITKALLESEVLEDMQDQYELRGTLTSLAVPATLQDSLMARLDRLGTAKGVAQLGATLGRTFTYDLIQAVSSQHEAVVQHSLAGLVEAGLVYQVGRLPQATFTFKHALIQETAYQSLLRSTRQQHHQRIARVLATRFPETAETQPELLAHHFREAGLHAQAASYWQRAGQRALERSANVEAVAHLTQGLQVLGALPDTPERVQQELVMQITLGRALSAVKGQAAPEMLQTYSRARELCEQVGETPQLFQVLRGLQFFYQLRMELQTARELGEELLTLAQDIGDPSLRLEAHYALGNTLNYLAEFAAAETHFEQVIDLYDPQQHRDHAFRFGQDVGVSCRIYAAVTLWCLGYPDQAVQQSHAALALARQVVHPMSLAYALFFSTWVYQFRREWQHAHDLAQACIDLTAEQGFMLLIAGGTMFRGWALAARSAEPAIGQAHLAEGIAQMEQGLSTWHATGAEVLRPYGLALLAEAHAWMGQYEKGLTLLAEALAVTNATEERRWEAELHRVKGELLLTQGPEAYTEAETCFRQALDVARHQQAKSWELRAATSLARLWQTQGKRDKARALLAPVYEWFTEGFDTADLKEAQALLHELEGSPSWARGMEA